jgi:hypothetical protein
MLEYQAVRFVVQRLLMVPGLAETVLRLQWQGLLAVVPQHCRVLFRLVVWDQTSAGQRFHTANLQNRLRVFVQPGLGLERPVQVAQRPVQRAQVPVPVQAVWSKDQQLEAPTR